MYHVSRTIYDNVDSPNLGFPYFNFLRGYHYHPVSWKHIRPERVHVGVDQDLDEGEQQVEDQPDVNHFDVGRFRQVV